MEINFLAKQVFNIFRETSILISLSLHFLKVTICHLLTVEHLPKFQEEGILTFRASALPEKNPIEKHHLRCKMESTSQVLHLQFK